MLRGIDVELRPGTLVRFHGTNGTGKSTLLRMLAGTDAPSEGRVEGRPRRVAYVPERFPGALPFTALGYVTRLGRIHGLRRSEAEERAGEWLERFGAAGHARTPLSALSKGTAQKVAVAQALVAAPQLLVLDEAWTGLDTAARDELDRAVAERVAAGATVAFVDHDPKRLAGAVDAAYRLEAHGLVPAGSPSPEESAGPRVRIVAVGPVGATAPAGLPGTPSVTAGPDGTTELTVASVHSDGVLRALLGARPAWHVRAVSPASDHVRAVSPASDHVQRPTPVRERNQA
ncbi:ATP-binding cassette domain-containing protein [Streptomyces sp. CA-294286]|uniref:ATP-binding cassette domain-containing protein n=1 Tax=Streptomyces sp. CA-294286 TaxID=3240070 RepID=UPI003D90346B